MALSTHIPLPAQLLARPRLLDRLDPKQAYRIAILSAPPGYGKTTLAAQFAHQVTTPVAWLTLEDRHRDVALLHHEMLDALHDIIPAIHDLPCPEPASPAERATCITRFLKDHLKQHVVMVLDDTQHLVDAPDAEAWLRALVKSLPRNCRLLLLSRTLPKLPLAELIAHRELVALNAEDLRFSSDEITQLLEDQPVESTGPLIDRLEGWPAGVMLALHPLPAAVAQAALGQAADPEALFQHLADALLDHQPPGLRQFLLESSTLTTITPQRCQQILHLANAYHWIDEAREHNLFLESITGGMAYHALFRDFLQARLKAQYRTRFDQLHRQAAGWFASEGQADVAFAHCMAADLFDLAATLAEQHAQPYFTQGRHQTLLAWERWLRPSALDTPHLWFICAMIQQDRYEYDQAEAYLARARLVFEARDDQTGIVNVALQKATIDLYRGAYPQAAALAETMLVRLPEPSGERGIMLNVLGLAHLYQGDPLQAVCYLEEALPLYRQENDRHALASLLQNLELAYTRCQRLDDAEACIQEVVALRHTLGHIGELAMALNNLGYHYHLRSDYRQAASLFREGLSLIATTSHHRAEAYLMWSLGDLQRDRSGFVEARSLYDKVLQLAGSRETSLQCAVLLSLSTLHRWQRQDTEAVARAQEALQLAESHQMGIEIARSHLLIRAAQSLTDPDVAIPDDWLADLKARQADLDYFHACALCTQMALHRQDTLLARRYLDPVFDAARQDVALQPFVAEAYHHPLLRAMVEHQTTAPLPLRDALKALDHAQLEAPLPSPVKRPTYSLRVTTFGQDRVEHDGQPVTTWRTDRARELFFYILLNGPRARDSICLHLWPDGIIPQVRANFHISLRRARDALGQEVLLFQDGLYLLNPAIDCWCDVWSFEALIQDARTRSPVSPQTEALWRKATTLYAGDFLPDIDAEWADTRREALRQMALDALVNLGRCLAAREDFQAALAPFCQALTLNPYHEAIHRDLMRCYAALGQRDQVAHQFRQLEQLLHDDLAVTPDPETQKLAADLTG